LVSQNEFGNRWMTVQLVGEGRAQSGFDRGITQFPTVGDTVHLVTEQDLRMIYGRPKDPKFVSVGHLASVDSIPALVDIDKLVTRHSAVVGATGSGKSTTVAGILAALSDVTKYPSARIIVIDIHGEYGKALSDRAAVFKINPGTESDGEAFYIPYWAMTFDELLPLTFGSLEAGDRGAIIEEITELKRAALVTTNRAGVSEDALTVDSPVPFSIHQLWFNLHTQMRATHLETPGKPQSRASWALEILQFCHSAAPFSLFVYRIRRIATKLSPHRATTWMVCFRCSQCSELAKRSL
jgi:hypothetical protein